MPPAVDMSLNELLNYKPALTLEKDFDSFWETTKKESQRYPINAAAVEIDYPIKEIKVYEASYDGFKGTRINALYILPEFADKNNKVPVIIHYHGYSYHRGFVHEYLKWVVQGFAVLTVNTRGQGGMTPDTAIYSQGAITGWMTLGILDKSEYYYRNAYMDCVRAVDFVCEREEIDTERIGIYGESQGGGLTLAVAGLDNRPKVAMPVYPYLCHFERALEMYQEGPYREIFDYFRLFDPEMKNRDKIFSTLSYFDGMNLAARINCPVLMAVTLRDIICPPSTMFAAYNHIASEKEAKIYPHHGHEHLPFHEEYMLGYVRNFLK